MEIIRCLICNNPARRSTFNVPPLAFFFTDQKIYNPSGKETDEYKVLPLCDNCYLALKRGQSFIENHLDFSIANPLGGPSGLSFWLVPNIGDPSKANLFLEDIEKQRLHLYSLRSLCEILESAETSLIEDISGNIEEATKSLMTFNALFYYRDKNGHMRLLGSTEGIYPARLRKLVEIRDILHGKYPYFTVEPKIHFSFPILKDFWATKRGPGWQKDLAELLGKIFSGSSMNDSYIYSVLANRLRAALHGPNLSLGLSKLREILELSLRAMLIIEYFEMSDVLSSPKDKGHHISSSPLNDPKVDELRKFLNSHPGFIKTGAIRALCCIGVAFGIALVEQERKIGSTSLWSHLSRLELDAEKLKPLFPLAMSKLNLYKAKGYDSLIAYIAANEVSDFDIDEVKTLGNDLLNLAFSIGLGEGHIIANRKWKEEN